MNSRGTLAAPVARPTPAKPATSNATELHAGLLAGDTQLRSAALAVALTGSRLQTEELRARYARVARKVTATGEDTAALMSRWAELLPHRTGRLRALSAAAEKAVRDCRGAAGGEGLGGPAPGIQAPQARRGHGQVTWRPREQGWRR
jgi:hypothetical protein